MPNPDSSSDDHVNVAVSSLKNKNTRDVQEPSTLKILLSPTSNENIKSLQHLKTPKNRRSKSKCSRRSFDPEEENQQKSSHKFVTLANTLKNLNLKKFSKENKSPIKIKLDSPDDSFCYGPPKISITVSHQAEPNNDAGSTNSVTHNKNSMKANHDTCNISSC